MRRQLTLLALAAALAAGALALALALSASSSSTAQAHATLLAASRGPCSLAADCTRGCALMVSAAPASPTAPCHSQTAAPCTEDVATPAAPAGARRPDALPASPSARAKPKAPSPHALSEERRCNASATAQEPSFERLRGGALKRLPRLLLPYAERFLRSSRHALRRR